MNKEWDMNILSSKCLYGTVYTKILCIWSAAIKFEIFFSRHEHFCNNLKIPHFCIALAVHIVNFYLNNNLI